MLSEQVGQIQEDLQKLEGQLARPATSNNKKTPCHKQVNQYQRMSSDQSHIADQPFRRQQKSANVSGRITSPDQRMEISPSQVEKPQLIPHSLFR